MSNENDVKLQQAKTLGGELESCIPFATAPEGTAAVGILTLISTIRAIAAALKEGNYDAVRAGFCTLMCGSDGVSGDGSTISFAPHAPTGINWVKILDILQRVLPLILSL